MKWPDETESVGLWDPVSGGTYTIVMNRYEIIPGMSYRSVLRALDASKELLSKVNHD